MDESSDPKPLITAPDVAAIAPETAIEPLAALTPARVEDAIVIGGSYAGVSAALQLARARRNVHVIDAGLRRNRHARHAHGFLGQEGRDPADLARAAQDELRAYPTVTWLDGRVTEARSVAPAESKPGDLPRFEVVL